LNKKLLFDFHLTHCSVPGVLAMFLSEFQQTVLHRLMTQSTQTHTALDHRTGAVKYLTAGKKKNVLLHSKIRS